MKRRERQWSTTHRYQSVCFMAPLIFSLGLYIFIFGFSLEASRYLSYLVYPLCISGAVFSLAYLRQKR